MSQVPGSSPAAPAVSSSDTAPTIESVLQEGRSFEPPAELAARARIGSMAAYRELAARAEADPDAFWGEQARAAGIEPE